MDAANVGESCVQTNTRIDGMIGPYTDGKSLLRSNTDGRFLLGLLSEKDKPVQTNIRIDCIVGLLRDGLVLLVVAALLRLHTQPHHPHVLAKELEHVLLLHQLFHRLHRETGSGGGVQGGGQCKGLDAFSHPGGYIQLSLPIDTENAVFLLFHCMSSSC